MPKNACSHCFPFHVVSLAVKTTRQRATQTAFIKCICASSVTVQRGYVGPDRVRNGKTRCLPSQAAPFTHWDSQATEDKQREVV